MICSAQFLFRTPSQRFQISRTYHKSRSFSIFQFAPVLPCFYVSCFKILPLPESLLMIFNQNSFSCDSFLLPHVIVFNFGSFFVSEQILELFAKTYRFKNLSVSVFPSLPHTKMPWFIRRAQLFRLSRL